MNIAAELRRRAAEVASIESLATPRLSFGSHFQTPVRIGGASGRWLTQDGVLEVDNGGAAEEAELVGRVFSDGRPRLLEVEDVAGHVLARQVITKHTALLQLGALAIRPEARFTLTLIAAPGPDRSAPSGTPHRSVFLSGLVLRPLPAYLNDANP